MTDIAQPATRPHHFLAREEEQRLISTWRLRAISFYGSILVLFIAFAAMNHAPGEPRADLASDNFVTHYISNPPEP